MGGRARGGPRLCRHSDPAARGARPRAREPAAVAESARRHRARRQRRACVRACGRAGLGKRPSRRPPPSGTREALLGAGAEEEEEGVGSYTQPGRVRDLCDRGPNSAAGQEPSSWHPPSPPATRGGERRPARRAPILYGRQGDAPPPGDSGVSAAVPTRGYGVAVGDGFRLSRRGAGLLLGSRGGGRVDSATGNATSGAGGSSARFCCRCYR